MLFLSLLTFQHFACHVQRGRETAAPCVNQIGFYRWQEALKRDLVIRQGSNQVRDICEGDESYI